MIIIMLMYVGFEIYMHFTNYYEFENFVGGLVLTIVFAFIPVSHYFLSLHFSILRCNFANIEALVYQVLILEISIMIQ